jgi:DNA-binding GntR family transcriptional regulator
MSSTLKTGTDGYFGIAEALKAQIRTGEWSAAERLPALSELARQFACTAITVRRALRLLEDEGLVRVEHGIGSFVADWARGYDLLQLPSFAAELASRAVGSETEVRDQRAGVRCTEAATALGLGPVDPVAVLTRVRRVGGRVVAFQRSYLPEAERAVVLEYTSGQSLYELLRDRTRRMPVKADEQLDALALPGDVARELEVERGSIGWASRRLSRDAEGVPLVYDEAYFPAERVRLRARRVGDRTSLGYEIIGSETGVQR